jgi:predicted secreted acid phosphatase
MGRRTVLTPLPSVAHVRARRNRGHLSAVVAVLALAAGVSCGTHSPATSVPNVFDTQRRVAEYIDSGRYEHDVAAVAAQAKAWLEKRAPAVNKPAIVLDIDETSLSNWPAYKVNGWVRFVGGGCDLQTGPCGLRAWQAMAQSKAIAPTLDLARRAKDMRVAVFFITGRPSNLRDATERNLREQGYVWDGVVLSPEGAQFASAADFKAPERRKLTEQGYTIVLNMGDQQSDLSGGFAEKTFKLPNPVYFLP